MDRRRAAGVLPAADDFARGAAEPTRLAWPVRAAARNALSARLQATAQWQYSSLDDLAAWTARLAWEVRPLSYVFLVINERRGSGSGGLEPVQDAVLKVTLLQQL
jgi:hypothetical protein